jgi:hypothetical protein
LLPPLRKLYGLEIQQLINPDYTEGSILSLRTSSRCSSLSPGMNLSCSWTGTFFIPPRFCGGWLTRRSERRC